MRQPIFAREESESGNVPRLSEQQENRRRGRISTQAQEETRKSWKSRTCRGSCAGGEVRLFEANHKRASRSRLIFAGAVWMRARLLIVVRIVVLTGCTRIVRSGA